MRLGQAESVKTVDSVDEIGSSGSEDLSDEAIAG